MQFVVMILVAMLVFGAVIFVHELGHFITAKKCGIRVNEFAIGMGPTLIKRKKGETTYALRLLPIGGFVSMEGEDEESDDTRGFQNASVPRRLLVMVAGAVMNILLGFIALIVVTTFSNGDLVGTRTVAQFMPNALTEQSGLQVGDTIIKANGRSTFVASDVLYEVQRSENATIDLTVRRDGEVLELTSVAFDPEHAQNFYLLGVPKTVGSVLREAGLQTLSLGRVIYVSLFDLVAGRVPINQLAGPVGIVSEIGKAVSYGWQTVVMMLALITINLGVVNMLPLPALDGGKVVLLLVEAVRRKPLNKRLEIGINVAGFALLMLLMLVVSFNDIVRIFT